MFFLLYKHTDDGVLMIFRRFPTTFRRFPKIFQNCPEGQTNVPENFRKFPKIYEDCRRLSRKARRCFDDTPTNLSTIYETNLISPKSSISSHVRISSRFYQFVTTRYTTDFYIIICVPLLNRSIQCLADHGASKEPKNPLWEWILRFL